MKIYGSNGKEIACTVQAIEDEIMLACKGMCERGCARYRAREIIAAGPGRYKVEGTPFGKGTNPGGRPSGHITVVEE